MIKELEDHIEEYRKSHPSTVGIKNGKTYDIAVYGDAGLENIFAEILEWRKPGAQPCHIGHFRIWSEPNMKIRVFLLIMRHPHSSVVHQTQLLLLAKYIVYGLGTKPCPVASLGSSSPPQPHAHDHKCWRRRSRTHHVIYSMIPCYGQ